MSNHYHWMLQTLQANLVEGMKWFQNTYTRRLVVQSAEEDGGDYLSSLSD
jgi:hypothetical protein